MSANPWQVQILGDPSDLAHLAKHLAATRCRIVGEETGSAFVYESAAFASCSDASAVLAVAKEELRVLSGVIKITRASSEPLRTGAVSRSNEAGGADIFLFLEDSIRVRSEIGEIRITDHSGRALETQPPSRTTALAELALRDAAVAKALRLLADPDHGSWVGLYRIYEVIEADVGGQHKLKKENWGTAKDLDRFKHSANSVTVAGDGARHGKEKEKPPSDPMSLAEADAYLSRLVQEWLTSKDA